MILYVSDGNVMQGEALYYASREGIINVKFNYVDTENERVVGTAIRRFLIEGQLISESEMEIRFPVSESKTHMFVDKRKADMHVKLSKY
jgi:hypothetical protein